MIRLLSKDWTLGGDIDSLPKIGVLFLAFTKRHFIIPVVLLRADNFDCGAAY